MLAYVIWNPSLIAFRIGSLGIRWYSLCWLAGLVVGFYIVMWLYKSQKVPEKYFDPLFIYCFVGMIVGSRLGHCLFYQPGYYFSSWQHVVEIVLPIQFMGDGSWRLTGYEGLASHGGTLGVMIALWLYYRHTHMNLWHVFDDIAITTPIVACLIRLGNLMNSEIVGRVTDVPWAFIFVQVDIHPRHPAQLYEALAYFIFFFVGLLFYRKHKEWVGTGFFFGLCVTLIFIFRFFIEYTKVIQEPFEAGLPLDMGQLLSVPFIIAGIACMKGGNWMIKVGAKPKRR